MRMERPCASPPHGCPLLFPSLARRCGSTLVRATARSCRKIKVTEAICAKSQRQSSRASFNALWIVPPGAVLALTFFYPLALIARQAFSDDAGVPNPGEIWRVVDSRFFVNALINTVTISAAATVGCLVNGLVLGLILAFVPFRGSVVIARLIDTFIALP